jgi:hypothetical protein
MPLDYSKFDKIEDSDDEREKAAVTRQPAKPWEAPVSHFSPPTRELLKPKAKSASGRECLEPVGMEEKLKIVAGGEDGLSEQLARWTPWAAPQLGTSPPEAEQNNSKPSEPKKVCVRSDGRKKVHTTFPDGSEMVEEFDERTDVLLVRKSRKPTTLGGEGNWEFEVGQAPERAFDPHSDMMRPSSSNPIFLRKDTPEHFQWRIRNLLYPANVYSVTIDHEKQQIVVRTSNKKYFKRIDVVDLARVGLKLKDENLSWKHQHNTLIISYARPIEVVKDEQAKLQLVDKAGVTL